MLKGALIRTLFPVPKLIVAPENAPPAAKVIKKERKPYNMKTLKTKWKMGKEKKQKTKMFHVKHF